MAKQTAQFMSPSRRRFLQSAIAAAGSAMSGASFRVWSNDFKPYAGKLLVTLQLEGGADVTQWCDPKTNTPGEPDINNWANGSDPGQAGNISFAPVADNASLFQRFGSEMVVINGVDAQTNSHETGTLFNWTGSNAEGMPSLSALHATAQSPNQPLAYNVFGGTSRTAGLISYNRFNDISLLQELSVPTINSWDGRPVREVEELAEVQRLVNADINKILASAALTPRQRASALRHQGAREGRESLRNLADILPGTEDFVQPIEGTVNGQNVWNNTKQQMQGALLVFKAGLGSAADIVFNGFDTHDNHDVQHEWLYTNLADAIGFFWDYAEELGLADRILLVMGSDFGRTNFYNDGDGKDHWNIGSYIVMERNANWGNRVVGATDALHFANPINPANLKESPSGVVMTPAHVHKAVRNYLGLEGFARDLGFGFDAVEDIPIFDRRVATVG